MPEDQELQIENFQVGDAYTRKTVADTGGVPRPKQDRDWTGIVSFQNCVLLFVTLDKDGFEASNQYHDVFDVGGTIFYWDSQRRNTAETPAIARIIDGEPVIVFVRIVAKIRNKTQPFNYVGKLKLLDYQGEMPVQMVYEVCEHRVDAPSNLRAVYSWEPSDKRKLRSIEVGESADARPRAKRRPSGSGQGRMLDPKKKKTIELRAMAIAEEYYEERGYGVTDTSKNSPFDLLCVKEQDERRVEVKGTTLKPRAVNVTANEVESAREPDTETDLFIVYDINVYKEADDYRAAEGEIKVLTNWIPEPEQLTPTQYVYHLP